MKTMRNFLIFIISLAATLFVMEIYISGAEIVTKSFNDYDDQFGRARKANAKYLDFNEGFGLGSFNEYGYLGPGYAPEKPSGTLKIALLGDSYVEGFQVFDRHHFRNLLEIRLSETLKKPVEVMNFGRSGFGIKDMYAYQKLFVQKFNPDIIIYFLSNGDLADMQDDKLLPKVFISSDSDPEIKIPTDVGAIEKYKKQLQLMQASSVFMMGRHGLMQSKDKEVLLKKLLDKLYPNKKLSTELKSDNTIDGNALTNMLNLLKDQHIVIVNIDRDSLSLPGNYQDMIILNTNQLLTKDGAYDVSFHTWKGSGKSGHWNHSAHQKVAFHLADKLTHVITESDKH